MDADALTTILFDVFEALDDGCQVIDADLRYVYLNPAAARHARRDRRELVGKTMAECYPGIERTEMFARLERHLTDRTTGRMDNEFTFPDGTTGFFDLRFVPVPRGLCVLSIDITERRRLETTLAQGEAAFRGVFAAIPDGTLLVSDGGEILLANDAAATVFGTTVEALQGASIESLVPSDLRTGHVDHRALFHHEPRARPMSEGREVEGQRADGSRFPVEVALGPVTFFGRRAALAIVRDLTTTRALEASLRRSEEQLRHAQKMEAIGRLAGGVAHDFNNILSVVLGYGTLLLDRLEDELAAADLNEIVHAAERGRELTAQLLAFSRQKPVAPEVLFVDDRVTRLERMLRRLVGEDVEVIVRTASAPARVQVDPGHVEQILMNLAVNARDAMPRGGKLVIETDVVELDEEYCRRHLGARPGRHVQLAISDTGSGMDETTKARLFEPFFTTKGVGQGTGLGLSTVFGIVRQAGGTIWVYSELGRGTTFKVFLPCVEMPAATAAGAGAPIPAGSGTILLAEDEPQLRQLLHTVLERAGYRVLVAPDPHEALALAAAHDGEIRALVTDVVMPRSSGTELAARLRTARPGVRVLYMSGYTGTVAFEHGLQRGDAFVQKPITPDGLLRTLSELLAR